MAITVHPSNSAAPSRARPHGQVLLHGIRRRPVIGFFVIAYAITWAVWIPMGVLGTRVTEGHIWPSHVLGLLGPAAAAFVVTAVVAGTDGIKDLLRRVVRWRVAGRWYLAALSPLLLYAGTVLILGVSGRGRPNGNELGTFSGLPVVAFPLMWFLLLLTAYAEETGWRGFAVQEMLKTRSLLWTAVVVGGLWALWHVPSFFVIQNYRDMGLAILPMFTLGLVSGSILLAWLYRASGGSVFVVALWHGSYNLVSGTAAAKGVPVAVVSTVIMVWAVAIIIAEIRAGRTKPGVGGIT